MHRKPKSDLFPIDSELESDESKTHSFLIHFSDLFLLYNCLFLFRNMEILPNLYFADFYRKNSSSSKSA